MAKPRHTQLERTAYHEAGHAVISEWLRIAVKRITIVADPEKGRLGHVENYAHPSFRPDIWDDTLTRNRAEREIMSFFAGNAAEKVLTGHNNWRGAERDTWAATELAHYVCGGDPEAYAYQRWLMIRTEKLVRWHPHWFAIEVLARALMEGNTINGRHAIGIIRTARKDSFEHISEAQLDAVRIGR